MPVVGTRIEFYKKERPNKISKGLKAHIIVDTAAETSNKIIEKYEELEKRIQHLETTKEEGAVARYDEAEFNTEAETDSTRVSDEEPTSYPQYGVENVLPEGRKNPDETVSNKNLTDCVDNPFDDLLYDSDEEQAEFKISILKEILKNLENMSPLKVT